MPFSFAHTATDSAPRTGPHRAVERKLAQEDVLIEVL